MKRKYGVEFKEHGKVYYFENEGLDIKRNVNVIVETEKGLQYGKVVTGIKELANLNKENLKQIIRQTTKEDYIQHKHNLEDAEKALIQAQKTADNLGLNMKFTEAIYTFDRNQLLFNFISDGRVDFRELAKELAYIYKTRIELRQIGVRDKAKEVSGIGACGRKLCCSCFLNDLDSVSISMAKNQNISLNPTKINGQCGRLLCCLNYEDDVYTDSKEGMPEIGERIQTEKGKGIVISLDILKRKFIVNLENNEKVEVTLKSKCDSCEKECCNK